QVRVKVTDGAAWSEWSAVTWMKISIELPNKLIAGGGSHSTTIDSDGLVKVWGSNGNGQLGDGSALSVIRTTSVSVPGVSGAVSVANGDSHTVVLKSDGSVVAWGYNYYGQLGDGTTTLRSVPVAVSGLTSGVNAVAAGSIQSFALKGDGTVWGWGQGYGSTPVSISGLSGIIAIASFGTKGMALKSDGTVWTWSTGVAVSQVSGLSGIT
ncbi:RCC1 domain-containing protein, partial [Paenibacillus sp. GCM10012306]|uniref:RCC1 domain-containing protein n=1 Tax=Paenibacillus sp. GCM10012306 TaxID=3317342 RepID=UPI00360B2075